MQNIQSWRQATDWALAEIIVFPVWYVDFSQNLCISNRTYAFLAKSNYSLIRMWFSFCKIKQIKTKTKICKHYYGSFSVCAARLQLRKGMIRSSVFRFVFDFAKRESNPYRWNIWILLDNQFFYWKYTDSVRNPHITKEIQWFLQGLNQWLAVSFGYFGFSIRNMRFLINVLYFIY